MTAPRAARSAYLISNAQVTGAGRRSTRRRLGSLRAVATSLVVNGNAVVSTGHRVTRRLDGDCEAPIHSEEVAGTGPRLFLDTFVRCRKCPACLRQRRRVWLARATTETGMAPRTWMVTLTADPQQHYLMLCRALVRLSEAGPDPRTDSEAAIFKGRADEFGKEVTKWLKRVRATGARFTYLMVVEAHKSGLPHVHLLIHDQSATTYRALTGAWRWGFAHAKLVEGPSGARYVTKYLVKSMMARVRASLNYGRQNPAL